MTEYYQITNDNYFSRIKAFKRVYGIKIELLSYYEAPIKEYTFQAIRDVSGSINIEDQQLTRRTCSLNLVCRDEDICDFTKYGDKFRLYLGLYCGSDVYWFSQGVYAVRAVNKNFDYFTIEGVDKGGILDGTIGLNMVDKQYIIPSGSEIRNVIIDTLALNLDGDIKTIHSSLLSRPVDPLNVFVDMSYKNTYTQADISIDSNAPLGDLLISLADGYNANIYYDVNGHFNFMQNVVNTSTDKYIKLPVKWVFTDREVADVQYITNSDIKNVVTVYTNSSQFVNVSETVYNTNPISPNRIDLIGIKRMDSVEIPYVGTSPEEQKKYCVAHGEYLLAQEEFNQNSITFSSVLIPHLDVGDRFIYKDDSFVIRSISINLGASDMTVEATQI